MGKTKTKTNQTSTNTYGWQTAPTTQAQQSFDTYVKDAFETPDPSIGYQFGKMRENIKNRVDNPFGHNYSPEVQEALQYSGENELDQQQGQALREDASTRKQLKLGGLGASAAAHAPVLTQTGGTMQGTQTQSQPWGNYLMGGISAGAQLGSAALT